MDSSQLRDQLFEDLIDFILRASPRDDLARDTIASRLENLGAADRAEIADRVRDGCSPLFLAATRGLPRIVIYLLDNCGANIDKKGVYKEEGTRKIHHVTPLWCAARSGHRKVCEVLVGRGADIHAVSDTGSTATRTACFNSKVAVVKYLVDKGADVNGANCYGVTCLMNSIQSVELSEFLIMEGANVNARDVMFRTALHFAVHFRRLGTVKLLLRHNADYLAQDEFGGDALRWACEDGVEEIANYFIDNLEYPPERIADAYELLGATFVDGNDNIEKAIEYWKKAVEHREKNNIVKDTSYPTHAVYKGLVPFRTAEELHALSVNLDQVRVHGLMISERVLGRSHESTIFRLLNRGYMFAYRLMYERSIDPWKYLVEILLFEGSVLDHEICEIFRVLAFALFGRYEYMKGQQNVDWSSSFNDVLFLLEKCMNSFPEAIEQLKIRPIFRTHEENWDCLLKTLVHLLHLAAVVPKSEDEDSRLEATLRVINRMAPTNFRGNSLLHLVVGCIDFRTKDLRFVLSGRQPIFPDPITTELLLRTGAAVEATNEDGSTALHVASLRVHYREEIVKSLLRAGAHIDRTNHRGDQPYRMLNEIQECEIHVIDFFTLRCLAATKIDSLKIKYENEVPKSLIRFVEMHCRPSLPSGVEPREPERRRLNDGICMFCDRCVCDRGFHRFER